MAVNIYLGSNVIKYNATPAGNIAAGGTNVCAAYVGTVQVFDNCAVANTNVQLQYTGSYGGNASGVIVENPLNNLLLSGQPGNTGTLTLYTPTYPGSGYTCTGGCPDVNPKSIAYTFPASGTTIINSTRSGGLNSNVPNGTVNVTTNFSGATEGVEVTSSVSNGGTITAAEGTPYSFEITYAVNSGWTGTITDPGLGTSGSYFESGTIQPGTTGLSVELNAAVSQVTYTLNAGSFNYSVTGGQSGVTFTAGSLSPSSQTKASGDPYTFTQSGLAEISPYRWDSGPNTTYTIGGVGGKSLSDTMLPEYDGQDLVPTVTGIMSLVPTSSNISSSGYSCPNNACINGNTSQQIWYAGTFPTTVYTNSNLTTAFSGSNQYYKLQGGGSLYINGSGYATYYSCTSFLTLFSNTSYASTSAGACGGGLSDNYYGDGGTLSTSSYIYNGNDGCTGTSNGYISDGSIWVQTNSSGQVIYTGSC
jgi:hypothetical protein